MKASASKLLRWIVLLCLSTALVTIGTLIVTDAAHGLGHTVLHSRLGAVALIMVGCSYVSLQMIWRRPRHELVKAILLGSAFALWGGEQLLPASRWTTAMDTAVIAIFVVDLGKIIFDELKRPAG